MSEIKEWHNPEFDGLLREVHGFFEQRQAWPLPLARAAIARSVTPEMWAQKPDLPPLQNADGSPVYEGYHAKTDQLLVIVPPQENLPRTQEVYLNALLAHGLTHSIAMSESVGANFFYDEAIAGIGEVAWLRHLQSTGIFTPANPIRVTRAGATVTVPAERRFLHGDDVERLPPNETRSRATHGMLASLAVELCLQEGEDAMDILRSAHPKADIRDILERRQKGLVDTFDQLPDDVGGIVRRLAIVQRLDENT
ncbi:MAG TPA: hypothetical protein VFZ48_05460 [Candidatus Saccharimonadales bacterium]